MEWGWNMIRYRIFHIGINDLILPLCPDCDCDEEPDPRVLLSQLSHQAFLPRDERQPVGPLWGEAWLVKVSPFSRQMKWYTNHFCKISGLIVSFRPSCSVSEIMRPLFSWKGYIYCWALGESDEMRREGGDGLPWLQSGQHTAGEWMSEWVSEKVHLLKSVGWPLYNGATSEQCSSDDQRAQEWACLLGSVPARGNGEDSFKKVKAIVKIQSTISFCRWRLQAQRGPWLEYGTLHEGHLKFLYQSIQTIQCNL